MSTAMEKPYYVYILSDFLHKVLYVGVTADLKNKVSQHKQGKIEDYTRRFKVNKLVYFEVTNDSLDAITRELQLRDYSRKKKVGLIKGFNPAWEDLFNKI
ncbi:MAG TPA: GIY-YIG nuclease family protein [Dehalococcoidales bacterium]|nr:GIY-YIG nuclease family protein [Dehalococcoidales bacterium]